MRNCKKGREKFWKFPKYPCVFQKKQVYLERMIAVREKEVMGLYLKEICEKIVPVDEGWKEKAWEKFSQLAMPLGSLGKLQEMVVSLCAMGETLSPTVGKRGVIVFCGDHGITAQGVSQVGAEVTSAVAGSLCRGETVMCQMAKVASCDVVCVDVGMKHPIVEEGLISHSLAFGTRDFSGSRAMTEGEMLSAVAVGLEMASLYKEKGYELLCSGEMGIGNTSSATAMTCALLGLSPLDITGAGAGLSSQGIVHKGKVIAQALAFHGLDGSGAPRSVLEILQTLGGFEIAAMMGLMLGCALERIPCVVDGFISNVSAYCAVSLCPAVKDYLLFSHVTEEKGGQALLQAMGVSPVLDGGFRLGEGSGAVALLPLLDMGLAVFGQGITFSGMEIEAYEDFMVGL